jgi:hypothetical protein
LNPRATNAALGSELAAGAALTALLEVDAGRDVGSKTLALFHVQTMYSSYKVALRYLSAMNTAVTYLLQ